MLAKRFSRREVIKMSGAAAVAALLAACQPEVVEKIVEKEVTKVVEVEVTKAPAEVIVISWATPAGLGLERTLYEGFSYKFMEENPGIKVKVSFESWDDYFTKLPTMVAAGVTPDVIHNHWTIAQDYAYNGVFIDHMPYMERDGVDPDEFVPEMLAEYAHGGKQYLLPKDSAINACYVNKSLFDEYGVPYPDFEWTIDDFATTCQLMTRDEDGRPANDPNFKADKIKVWGFQWSTPTMAGDWPAAFTNALGTHWFSDDFKTSHFDHEGVIQFWKLITDLRCTMRAIPSPGEALGMGDLWRNAGVAAMKMGHHSETFYAKQEKARFEYDIVGEPGGPFGQFAIAASSGFGVTTNAPHKEEGWKLLNFLTSEETQAYIGAQKRWGVQRKGIMDAIDPDDGIPEHFADVHTGPFMDGYTGPLKKLGMIAPVFMNQIKEIYATEMEPLFSCLGGSVAEAAQRVKKQVDELLAEVDW